MPKILKKRAHHASGSTSGRLHTGPHTHDAPPLTTANVKLCLQATLDFHVSEPPLLSLRARSNSQDMSALASQSDTRGNSTAAATVALRVYAGGASRPARAGRARTATGVARARARAPAHPSPRGCRAPRAPARRAVAAPSCSAVVMSTRRPLDYGETDHPCKMTYSRMAFSSRPCCSCEAGAKIAAHVHAQQLSEGARVSSSSSSQHAHEWPWHQR
jgi:hypothetical protein